MLLFQVMLWRKLVSSAFGILLIGYLLALSAMTVSVWLADPPSWSAAPQMPAPARAWTPPTTNTVTIPNGLVKLSWKTSMTISSTMKVNSEDISQSQQSLGTNFHDPWWKLWQ